MNRARLTRPVAFLALLALARCGPIVVKCPPDDTPVVLPRSCVDGFEGFAAEKIAKLKVDIEYMKVRVGADAELGSKIAQLGESMNQFTLMYRAAWVGACNARRSAPCDAASRAKILEIEQTLVELIGKANGELARAKGVTEAAGGTVPADPEKKQEIRSCIEKAKDSLTAKPE